MNLLKCVTAATTAARPTAVFHALPPSLRLLSSSCVELLYCFCSAVLELSVSLKRKNEYFEDTPFEEWSTQ